MRNQRIRNAWVEGCRFARDLWHDERGAVTITVIDATLTVDTHIADVEATLDADTTATIPHGLVDADGVGVTPSEVYFTPLLQVLASLSLWAVTTIDATNVVLTKAVTAGSGGAGDQIRVIAKKPHTLGR